MKSSDSRCFVFKKIRIQTWKMRSSSNRIIFLWLTCEKSLGPLLKTKSPYFSATKDGYVFEFSLLLRIESVFVESRWHNPKHCDTKLLQQIEKSIKICGEEIPDQPQTSSIVIRFDRALLVIWGFLKKQPFGFN